MEIILGAIGMLLFGSAAAAGFTALSRRGKAVAKGALNGARAGAAKAAKKAANDDKAAKAKGVSTAQKLAKAVQLDKETRAARAAAKITKAKESNRETAAAAGINVPVGGRTAKAGKPAMTTTPTVTSVDTASRTLGQRFCSGTAAAGKATGRHTWRGITAADRWQRGIGQKVTTATRTRTAKIATGRGWTGLAAKLAPSGGGTSSTPKAPTSEPVSLIKPPKLGPLFPPDVAASRKSSPTDPSPATRPTDPTSYGALMANLPPAHDPTVQKAREAVAQVSRVQPANAGALLNLLSSLPSLASELSTTTGLIGQHLATGRGIDRKVLNPLFAAGEQVAQAIRLYQAAAYECRNGPYKPHYDIVYGVAPTVKDHEKFFSKAAVTADAPGDVPIAAPAR